jgi:hypothetical protein
MRRRVVFALLIIVVAAMIPGCTKKDIPKKMIDPVSGDLALSISMEQTNYNQSPESMILMITLENICPIELEVDHSFSFVTNLKMKINGPDNREVHINFSGYVQDTDFNVIKPGENISTEVDLVRMVDSIDIDGTLVDWKLLDKCHLQWYQKFHRC